jgi:hypothetical protein
LDWFGSELALASGRRVEAGECRGLKPARDISRVAGRGPKGPLYLIDVAEKAVQNVKKFGP